MAIVQDPNVVRAVSRVLQRSERQDDIQKLLESFVDVGSLPLLDNRNHQILYGRRGTGKTHVMRVLGVKLAESAGSVVVYEDARTLGSTAQFSDPTVPLRQRCLALFRDILGPVQNSLMDRIATTGGNNAEAAFVALERLASAISDPVRQYREEKLVSSTKSSDSSDSSMGAQVSLKNPQAGILSSEKHSRDEAVEKTFKVENDDKVVFPALHEALAQVLELTNATLFLIIDEWSNIPLDIQPYLAEFLKRGLLPVQRAVLKVGALEYRCRFQMQGPVGPIGFELGADVATAAELDDYFVYDRNPQRVADAYASILVKHLSLDLPDGYLLDKYKLDPGNFASRVFTQKDTFFELARAAEGVIRDLINIFTLAFLNAQRRGRDTIDLRAILEAARLWFEQDKSQHLDDRMNAVLGRIISSVIGGKKARSFMLPRALEKHPIIQRLLDARVLHHVLRGYADKDNPGLRYNIYTLDYGTYVDLIGTQKQPDMGFQELEGPDLVVPFDDKRSIRRIVLTEADLEP